MSALTGTSVLIRFFLRRDRLTLLAWVAGAVLLYWGTAVGVDGIYTTQAEFNAAAKELSSNSALIALAGPARALNTTGGQVAWQAGLFGEILAALMSMFLVARHTRSEEESGRDEMVRSGVVGRFAPQTATAIVVTIANLLLGFAVAVVLIVYGLGSDGSIALGLGAAEAGLFFMGVALVAAQLSESTRIMYGVTGAVIGVSYMMRAVGDVGNGVLSWLSPLGWGQAMQAFAGVVWWPVLLSLAGASILTGVSMRIFVHRDVGGGVLPTKPGPARAGGGLQGAFGLAWNLQRGTLFGWAAGVFLAGLAYGSAGGDVEAVIGTSGVSDAFAQGSGSLTDSFYATALLMLALIGSSFSISAALRLRSEEEAGRVEGLLATSLGRNRWVASHVLMMVAGSAFVLGFGGLGTGVSFAFVANDIGEILRMFLAAIAYLPALWVLGGLALALFGFLPRVAAAVWIFLVFCLVAMFFGPTFNFPQWLLDISPFSHIPLMPSDSFDGPPLVGTAAVAAVLIGLGFLGFRRRDVDTA